MASDTVSMAASPAVRSRSRGAATWFIVGAVSLVTGGCVSVRHSAPQRPTAPAFDPIAFFSGATEGYGTLKIVLKGPQPTLVEGHGRIDGDGAITLDQTVRRGDTAPTRRTWHLRRVAAGRYTGTLTDASGPVSGEVSGNRLHLAFAMKGGTQAQQWLYLEPGGQAARNVMVVRKLGLPVARLDETIMRK